MQSSHDETVEQLRKRLREVERQRDSAFARIVELVSDIETHRDFWRGGRAELEDAKLLAAQSYNRAQRLQAKVRGGMRRERDRENEALRDVFIRRFQRQLAPDAAVTMMQVAAEADGLLGKVENGVLTTEATRARNG